MVVSILLPTHNHGDLLLFAVQSILEQTFRDFEVFIIGDGPTAETKAAVNKVVWLDPRIVYCEFDKAGRTGEPHRHTIITQRATGEYIFYLSDDDVWTKKHLEKMVQTLKDTGGNFCNSPYVVVNPDRTLIRAVGPGCILPAAKANLLGGNFIPLSCGSHSRDLYMKLTDGWTVTPLGEHTDHYMWKKLVSHPDCRPVSSGYITAVNFPSYNRQPGNLEARAKEMTEWLANHGTEYNLCN